MISIKFFRCNGERDCYVVSSNTAAGGDPCVGIKKYTEVSYICMQPQTIIDACKDDVVNLYCNNGLIKVF